MVSEEPWGVILLFNCRFAKQRKGPSDLHAVRRLPFRPESFESFPGVSRHGIIEEKMLRGFLRVRIAHFALCGEANLLEPGPDREILVEDQPNERAHLPWVRVVSESGRHLSGRDVPKVEVKKEGLHVGCVV